MGLGQDSHPDLLDTKAWVPPPSVASHIPEPRSPASQAVFSLLAAASAGPRQWLRREVTVNEMEGAPVTGLECWKCTEQVGKRREGVLSPPPQAHLGRPPATWLLSLPGGWSCSSPLPARLIGAKLASCIINSTASLPVFTLITCWGGWVGGREQGGKPWSFEGPSLLRRAALRGLAQPQVSEVGFWSFPHLSPQEGTRDLGRKFMWEVGMKEIHVGGWNTWLWEGPLSYSI